MAKGAVVIGSLVITGKQHIENEAPRAIEVTIPRAGSKPQLEMFKKIWDGMSTHEKQAFVSAYLNDPSASLTIEPKD